MHVVINKENVMLIEKNHRGLLIITFYANKLLGPKFRKFMDRVAFCMLRFVFYRMLIVGWEEATEF